MQLSKILEAEKQADTIVQQAEEQKTLSMETAVKERNEALQGVTPPKQKQTTLKPLQPDIEKLKRAAKKNMDTAVEKILEEFYASF